MKKILSIIIKFINILYKILPFFLGIYCYYPIFTEQDGHAYPLLDAAYASIRLYSGSTEGGIEVGVLLQLARFMALAATLSILINVFNKLNDLLNGGKLCAADSTVVYGESAYANYMYESLSPRLRIRSGGKFIKHASRYLIMFSGDARNLEFYNRNYNELKNKRVYLMIEDTERQNIENPFLTIFSISENCARQYWQNFFVEENEKIAIIGFDNVGKDILLYGLQMNIIDPNQRFEYHIYGDGSEFRREHTELDKINPDKIIYHDGGISEFTEMSAFDRIIVCGSGDRNDNISTVSKLLEYVPNCPQIHVYAPNGDIVTNLFGNEKVKCFGMAKDVSTIDMILNEKSMEAARRQHEFYARKYGGVPWEKLDSFKRYSNVSSSDYMYMLNRLFEKGVPLETIAELEHIRWCRYHYIYNWKYGSETDTVRRIHNCLVPFGDLSKEEQVKDVEAILSKLSSNKY